MLCSDEGSTCVVLCLAEPVAGIESAILASLMDLVALNQGSPELLSPLQHSDSLKLLQSSQETHLLKLLTSKSDTQNSTAAQSTASAVKVCVVWSCVMLLPLSLNFCNSVMALMKTVCVSPVSGRWCSGKAGLHAVPHAISRFLQCFNGTCARVRMVPVPPPRSHTQVRKLRTELGIDAKWICTDLLLLNSPLGWFSSLRHPLKELSLWQQRIWSV